MFELAPKDNTFLQIKDKVLESIVVSTDQEPSDEEVESLAVVVHQAIINAPILQFVQKIKEIGFDIEYTYDDRSNQIRIFKSETINGKIIYGILGNEQ